MCAKKVCKRKFTVKNTCKYCMLFGGLGRQLGWQAPTSCQPFTEGRQVDNLVICQQTVPLTRLLQVLRDQNVNNKQALTYKPLNLRKPKHFMKQINPAPTTTCCQPECQYCLYLGSISPSFYEQLLHQWNYP